MRALIFDFDGLILDTELPVFQSWQEVYSQHGCELTLDTWADIIGRPPEAWDPVAALEERLGKPLDGEVIKEAQVRHEMALIEQQPVLPGVLDYVEAAARLGLRLGIASSSSQDWVRGHLSRLGLDSSFEEILTADMVERAKPAPDLYLATLEALAVQPDEALALEDSPHGVTAAKSAGIYCVAIPNALTAQLPLDHADLILPSLEALSLEDLLVKVGESKA